MSDGSEDQPKEDAPEVDQNSGNDGQSDVGTEDSSDSDESRSVDRAEYEKLEARMKAADKRASAAEAKIKEAEDAKKSELQKAQDELETAKKEMESLKENQRSLAIRNAFLSSNKVTWHDPEDAFKMADLAGVEISDHGVVDSSAVVKAIEDLAKKKPYLVKTDSAEGTGNGGSKTRKGDPQKPDKETQAKRFPAIARH